MSTTPQGMIVKNIELEDGEIFHIHVSTFDDIHSCYFRIVDTFCEPISFEDVLKLCGDKKGIKFDSPWNVEGQRIDGH